NLKKVERDISAISAQNLLLQHITGNFDLAHLQTIHRELFGNVYDWAGKIRRVDISKGNTRFANFAFIENESRKLLEKLKNENYLRVLDKDKFAERAAYYLDELNVLHPFREGNGRTLRLFMTQLAIKNGFQIHWQNISAEQMIQACIQAYHADGSLLARLIIRQFRTIVFFQTTKTSTNHDILRKPHHGIQR
ncbi:TPA: Fic/DOC family protein, partial [Neisseria gonorrhoeae]